MSVVSRSDSACARSTSSGIEAITPPTLSASGLCRPASSPNASARSSSCRLLASSFASGSSSGRFLEPMFSPLLPLIPRVATVRFLDRTPIRTGILGCETVPRYVRLLAIPLLPILLAACQIGSPANRATPSVSQIGSDLKCSHGDHAFEDNVAGWGFCYPGTWKYNLRAQSVVDPPELDLVFDITDVPCVIPSAQPGETPRPVGPSHAGREHTRHPP